MKQFLHIVLCILWAAGISACCLVDEDMRDCQADHKLDYQLQLVTNMTTELKTELETNLSTALDLEAAAKLKEHLSDIFTDYAHDVDLSFYDVTADSVRLHHESHIMDANQSSYTLYIPVRQYMHLALANQMFNGLTELENEELCHSATLRQTVKDTIPCHKTGLFTARLPMDVKEGVDQNFDVHLYMANCATAIVVDTTGSGIKDLKVYATGFATDFNICDSLYRFRYSPVVQADEISLDIPGGMCFVTVNFPSKDIDETKSVIDTDDPFVSPSAPDPLWRIRTYTTLADGTVTETILGVTKPLRPGQLKVIKAKAHDNGSVQPGDPTIGFSVTLDWKKGLSGEIEL